MVDVDRGGYYAPWSILVVIVVIGGAIKGTDLLDQVAVVIVGVVDGLTTGDDPRDEAVGDVVGVGNGGGVSCLGKTVAGVVVGVVPAEDDVVLGVLLVLVGEPAGVVVGVGCMSMN